MEAMLPMYGVVFVHPFGQRRGLPEEVPVCLHGDMEPTVLRQGRLSVTLWQVPALQRNLPNEFFRPQLCNPTSEDATVFWSAWRLFRTELSLLDLEDFATLSPEAAKLLGDLLEQCHSKVQEAFNDRLEHYRKSLAAKHGHDDKKIKSILHERKRLQSQQLKLISGIKTMRLGQVWTLKAFDRAMPPNSPFRETGMTWSQVCSLVTQVPMLAVRPKNSRALVGQHFFAQHGCKQRAPCHSVPAYPFAYCGYGGWSDGEESGHQHLRFSRSQKARGICQALPHLGSEN